MRPGTNQSGWESSSWMIDAEAGASAFPTTISHLQVRMWRSASGNRSAIRVTGAASPSTAVNYQTRQVSLWTEPACVDWNTLPDGAPCPMPVNATLPLHQLGNGHVRSRQYDLHCENSDFEAPSYRHALIANTTEDSVVRVYHLNTEHAQSDSNTEVRNASGRVDIFGMKSEGHFGVLWVKDPPAGARTTLYGYGGNACPFSPNSSYPDPSYADFPPTLFRLSSSSPPARPATVTIYLTHGFEMPGTLTSTAPSVREMAQTSCLPPNETATIVTRAGGKTTLSEPSERPASLVWTVGG